MTKKMPREIYAWMGHQDNGSWDKEPCPCCPSVKYFRADAQSAENADCIEWLNEIRCWIKRCKDTDWGEDDEAICETIRAALTEAPKVDVEKDVADIVRECMQDQWNDWCADTGCFPCDFEKRGRKLHFQAGSWASNVGRAVHHKLTTHYYLVKKE